MTISISQAKRDSEFLRNELAEEKRHIAIANSICDKVMDLPGDSGPQQERLQKIGSSFGYLRQMSCHVYSEFFPLKFSHKHLSIVVRNIFNWKKEATTDIALQSQQIKSLTERVEKLEGKTSLRRTKSI